MIALEQFRDILPFGSIGRLINSFIFINHPDSLEYQTIFRIENKKRISIKYHNYHLKLMEEIIYPNNPMNTIFLTYNELNKNELDLFIAYENKNVDRIPVLEPSY